MKLRDYQQEALQKLMEKRQSKERKALIVMAMGLGKTVISALDVGRFLRVVGGRALLLCHNNVILSQDLQVFKDILGDAFTYGLYNGISKVPDADIVFASYQTMLTDKELFSRQEFSYIIVDEAHHAPAATFKTVVSYFQPNFLLGLTATPLRLDGLSLEEIFGEVTYDLGLIESIQRGLLVDIDYHLMLDEMVNLESVVVDGEKISASELNRKLFVPKRDEEIANIIKKKISEHANGATLIFCRSIEHAKRMNDLIENSGVVHSGMSNKLCEQTLKQFKSGKLSVIISVDQLNEGIDIPHADTIVFLRSTVSPIVFYQQLGRGLRLHEAKKHATILDFVGSYERLKIVHDLQQKINISNYADNTKFILSIDAPQFKDRIISIEDLLESLRHLECGWTDEELIKKVQNLAEQLGKIPSSRDFIRSFNVPSYNTISRRFGSWRKFMEIAGFKIKCTYDSRGISDAELIHQVQSLAEKLGKTPTFKEFNRDPTTASSITAQKHFGSYNKFLEKAGLELNCAPIDIVPDNGELIAQVQMLATELKRTPTSMEFGGDKRTVSVTTVRRRFGTWNQFLKAANLPINREL